MWFTFYSCSLFELMNTCCCWWQNGKLNANVGLNFFISIICQQAHSHIHVTCSVMTLKRTNELTHHTPTFFCIFLSITAKFRCLAQNFKLDQQCALVFQSTKQNSFHLNCFHFFFFEMFGTNSVFHFV